MARLEYADLINAIKEHPDYYEKWQKDVPADQSIYIKFGGDMRGDLESKTFEAINGLEIVLDFDSEMKICGIEII